ncbi:Protein Y73F8A.35 b [Aphelenchoides avenae]|nr:Protein Y73F8A.35 b [Aphelenchus avenae]
MDNESFIGYEFSRRGYASMMCEDWYTAMNYPDCVGFRKPPADHYFVPFALRYDWSKEGKEDRTLYNNLEKNTCTPQYKYSMNYLRDFIDAYPDRPKWTMTWIVTLAHNNDNSLYPTDDDFANFFKQYKRKMRNAFLFVVGDHGLRHTSLRQTKQGALEDYNPVSIVVVPERLRKNEHLMGNLRKNAQQLTTHYDLYATLQNLAREGSRMTVDTLFDRLDTSGWGVTLHGESYFYPFNATVTRNCVSQRVPEEYCLCQRRQVNRTKEKQPLAVRIARFLVDRINAELKKEGASSACATLSLRPDRLVELLDMNDTTYRVTYSTLPGGARFWANVKVLFEDNQGGAERFDLEERKIARLDSYEEQSRCIKTYKVRPYCFCRDLIVSTKT